MCYDVRMEKSANIPEIVQPPEKQVDLPVFAPSPTEGQKPAQKRTWGNIIYDIPVFGGVAWVGNAVLSATSAHESNYGKNKYFGWLRVLNDTVFKFLKSNLSKTILKDSPEKIVDGYAHGTTLFVTLGMGGNALMAPIKWMEDNRQKNAAKIDKLLGTTPPDQKTIANEPKQTWKSVFSGRLLSWVGSFVVFLGLGSERTKNWNNLCGEKATNAWMKFKPHSNPVSVRRWADLAAFDAIFTSVTATITYVFSRYFAKKEGRKADAQDEIFEINTVDPRAITREFDENKPEKEQKSFVDKLPKKPASFIERANQNTDFSPSFP